MLTCTIAFLFLMKYKVQTINKEIKSLTNAIIKEKETIHILHAEWAYLTQPTKITKLASKHLNLQPIPADKIKILPSNLLSGEEK